VAEVSQTSARGRMRRGGARAGCRAAEAMGLEVWGQGRPARDRGDVVRVKGLTKGVGAVAVARQKRCMQVSTLDKTDDAHVRAQGLSCTLHLTTGVLSKHSAHAACKSESARLLISLCRCTLPTKRVSQHRRST